MMHMSASTGDAASDPVPIVTSPRAAIHTLVAKICRPYAQPVDDQKRLVADLSFDGLDLVTLALTIEDEFYVACPDATIIQCLTVGDVVALVERLKVMSRG